MPPKIAKLAGLGAFGACGGLVAVYALFIFITRPTQYSGMDSGLRFVSWVSVAGVILLLIAAHVALGRQLMALSTGEAQKL